MRQLVLIIVLCFFHSGIYGQISTFEEPESFRTILPALRASEKTQIILPEIDMEKIRQEDKEDEENGMPPRFGYRHEVNYNLENSGEWTDLPNGDKIWRLAISCTGALSINLLYDKFWLPEGAKFFIYSNNRKHSIGAFTSTNNKGSRDSVKGFATGLVYGEQITLECFIPKNCTENAIISIAGIVHGYKNILLRYGYGEVPNEPGEFGFECSSPNNININCPEGDNWQNEKRAVALIVVDGERWCTGALMNNTNNDYTPYFLTADHCLGDKHGDDLDLTYWTFYWNYELPPNPDDCKYNNSNPPEPFAFCTSRAFLLASHGNSDFALLKLDEDPIYYINYTPSYFPYYLGWDRSGNPGTGGVGIHHPKGDVKKISTYIITPLSTNKESDAENVFGNYWRVTWSSGLTEEGSSGSPLINNNHRVIGQLYGGISYRDWYGKFSASWKSAGPIDPIRDLQPWLDAAGIGVTTLDGVDVDICNNNLPAFTKVINQNTIWNSPQKVTDKIMIQNGATLTITSIAQITPNASITVAPGGKLIIDGGTLTNACQDQLWQGITVSGKLKNQGEVHVINNAAIENAHCAVTVEAGGKVVANDAHFTNNTMGVFFNSGAVASTFKRTNFVLDDDYFSNKSDFIAHIRAYSSTVSVEGCTFSSTAPINSTNNRGIDAVDADITIKEHCPKNCGVICQGCFCTESCMDKTLFTGFSKAVSAINTGTTPTLKVRFSNFTRNLYGIYISGIHNHELIKNNFVLEANKAVGVAVGNATGYKIEENVFTNKYTDTNDKTVGLSIKNSGTAENEVYKNEFFGLAYAQEFSSRNSSQLDDTVSMPHDSIIIIHRNLVTGLQSLCNIFNNSIERDIFVGSINPNLMMKNLAIRKEQGSSLIPAGNQFNGTQILNFLNIDNSKSLHLINYHYNQNISNQYPPQVSSKVYRWSTTNSNSCPSKIGTGGPPTKSGIDFTPYLAQYDEWNAQYEYWLARAGEVCGLGYGVRGERYEVSGGDDECSAIWGMVSHYSALKDNYFNAIIVAAMSNYELRITNYEFEGEINGRISPSNFEGVPEGRGSLYENLRFLFSYRGQYGDYLSITETYLAENNYREALATLTQMHEKFKLTEEQISEVTGLRIYTHWLQQLEKQENSIYTLSENEIEYLVNYAEAHSGRGVVFVRNILCGLYGICLEEAEEQKSRMAEKQKGGDDNQSKSAQSVSSEFKINPLENIQIFPNPTTGELRIESSKFKVQRIEISDVYGRALTPHTSHPIPLTTIDISHLHPGIYFIKITTDAGMVVKKIIKQ